jgi:hypothetical protein
MVGRTKDESFHNVGFQKMPRYSSAPELLCPRYGTLKFGCKTIKCPAMDKRILKQLLRGAREGSELPSLSKQETELYISHLQARGIVAKATYWDRDGAEVLAFFKITNASPEIDAKIDRILKG